jgi:hypothetical protein
MRRSTQQAHAFHCLATTYQHRPERTTFPCEMFSQRLHLKRDACSQAEFHQCPGWRERPRYLKVWLKVLLLMETPSLYFEMITRLVPTLDNTLAVTS